MQIVLMLHRRVFEERQRDLRRNDACDLDALLVELLFGVVQKRRQARPVIDRGFDAARHRTIGPETADRMLYRLTENPIEPSADIARRIDRLAAGLCEFLRGLRSFLNRFRFVGHESAPQNASAAVASESKWNLVFDGLATLHVSGWNDIGSTVLGKSPRPEAMQVRD